MEAALNQLRAEGMEVKPADVARLSPLIHKHINFQGVTPSPCLNPLRGAVCVHSVIPVNRTHS